MHNPPPYVANWAPAQRSSSGVMRTALVIGGLLALVLLASPYMPEVIRIPVPGKWLRFPKLEFVGNGGAPEPAPPTDPSQQLATSAPLVPEVVPPDPAPSATGAPPAVDSTALALAAARDSLARLEAAMARANAARRKPAPPRRRAPPVEELEPDGWQEGDGELAPERGTTIVPVRVQTSVSLAPARPQPEAPRPAPDPDPRSAPAGEESWPLLCGEVISFTGVPVEGARVELVSPPLTVRTDRRGRFCIACPPGARVVRVEHAAFEPVNRAVELKGETLETRIWLTTPR